MKTPLICLQCSSDEFDEDPNAVVVQLYRGMHLELHTPVMVCRKCGWMALTGTQTDALLAKTRALYDQVISGQAGVLKLDRVEEAGDKVQCDNCSKVWTERTESGGFIYDNNAYCPSCCAAALVDGVGTWDPTQILHCPKDISFADWIRQFRYKTGQTQIKHYSGKHP